LKIFLLILIFVNIYADNNSNGDKWTLKRSNFYYENDTFFLTDYGYTSGARISWLYEVENPRKDIYDIAPFNFGGSKTYRSFSMVNQIYTPEDTNETKLITDDRPYAGWTYFEIGLHKSSRTHLRSLNIRLGVVGRISGSEYLQNLIHSTINEPKVKGWDNQLHNEIGLNLKYTHKWKFSYEQKNRFESSIIPFSEFELGNISTKGTVGVALRFGRNIQKDFGVSSINIGAEDGIPSYKQEFFSHKKKWGFSINMYNATSLIYRNIFLDGNTFKNSHSVKKNLLVGYSGLGFTLRYKQFVVDFMQVYTTSEFESEENGHLNGSLIFSWLYN